MTVGLKLLGPLAFAGMVTVWAGGAAAADYGTSPYDEGYDGFAYQNYGYSGHGYPLYGYGGYIGPYYRNGCFGVAFDCGPVRPHRYSKHYTKRVKAGE